VQQIDKVNPSLRIILIEQTDANPKQRKTYTAAIMGQLEASMTETATEVIR